MILRAEKGFIVIGKDMDGTTMLYDLGVTGQRGSRADEYIGKRRPPCPSPGPAPQTTGRPECRGGRRGAADRRACRRRRGQSASVAWLRDVKLLQSHPRRHGRAWPDRSGAVAHRRDGGRLPPRRRAARDDHGPRSRSIDTESGYMREVEWPPARGGARLLIDGPRLTAGRLGGLEQTLISGEIDAAVAALALGAPMLGLYALAPAGALGLCIGRMSALLVTPSPCPSPAAGATDGARPPSTTAGRRSRSRALTQPTRSCR